MASITETGKIYQILPLQSGTSKAGNPWANQQVVFEVIGFNNTIRRVVATTRENEILSLLETLKPGTDVEFSYSVSAREWTDKAGQTKWFADVTLFSLKSLAPAPAATPKRGERRAATPAPAVSTEANPDNIPDMPF